MSISSVLHDGVGLTTLGVAALAGLTAAAAPGERRGTLTRLVLFGACLAGLVAASLMAANDLPRTAEVVRGVALLGEGLAVIALVGGFVFQAVLPRLGVVRPRIVQDVAVAAAFCVWAVIRLRVHNVDLTSILATSAVVTAVIGLSLQDTLGNILGGMALQFDESVGVGDWIKSDDTVGRVVEIRWRYTAVETRNWETVIIPNSVLVKNKFQVLGRRRGEPVKWRRWVWFNVDYRYQPSRVIEMANRAIRSAMIPNVAATPEPNCVVMDFADSVGRYAVRYWLTDLAADDTTDSEVRKHLFFALKRAGIPLSIPAHAVFVTKDSAKRKALKSGEDLDHRAAAIGHVDLFHGLQPDELRQLAGRLVPTPFARDDVMIRQGAPAQGLYVIVEGLADVVVEDRRGHSRKVASLGPGSFFGEMGLMTGEPRSATVVARTEVECYRLDKEAFQDILRSRPAVAEDISHVLAQRRTELDEALEDLDAEARQDRLSHARHDILGKIRRFFGLDAEAEPADVD
jgi:CRP-like cAMP-binding protein/small-conductance mechanosensitive channel